MWHWSALDHLPWLPPPSRRCEFKDFCVEISKRFPFVPGLVDYFHLNSLYYDVENDAVYVNSRYLDTFFKIKRSTGEIEWSVGRVGSLAMFDRYKKNTFHLSEIPDLDFSGLPKSPSP